MSEDILQSLSGQQLISQYFQTNQEVSMDKSKQPRKRRIEQNTQQKKQLAKIKSDSDESNEQLHAINQVQKNTLDRYCKPTQGKAPIVRKVAPKIEVKVDEDAAKLSQKIMQLELVEKQLRFERNQLEQEKLQNEEKHKQFKKKSQDIFAEALKQNEELKREKLKNSLEREKHRLGEFVSRRDNVRFMEEWSDGDEIKQVKMQLKKLELEIFDLEKMKGDLKNKSQSFIKKNNEKQTKLSFNNVDDSNSQGDLDVHQRKQRLSFQLNTLQKEEIDLKSQLQKLDEQKQQLSYKIKKYNDEQQCRYIRSDPPWPCIDGRYQILGLSGKGGFSEVYKAFDLEEFRYCACKIHQLNTNWSENAKNNYIKHALRENEIHNKLKHHNIVSLYDTKEIDQDSFCTVLEYCEGSDLSHYLKKYKILSEKEGRLIIRQVLAALHYMSTMPQKVIHYDLKPQNILFHKGEVKITDFGLCKTLDHDATRLELTSQGVGTYWYLPPECFMDGAQSTISTKVDVWSVGVIMFEMVFGRKPYGEGMSQERIVKEQVILKSYQPIFPQKPIISQECKDFISKCLTYNMEARWDISETFLCPYINKK